MWPAWTLSLASMLMLGATSYQRIDGMGLARKALEAELTGDPRPNLSVEERCLLASARAWCLLVHGDLGMPPGPMTPSWWPMRNVISRPRGTRAGKPHAEPPRLAAAPPGPPNRGPRGSGRGGSGFARLPDHQRNSSTQGAAVLASRTGPCRGSCADAGRARCSPRYGSGPAEPPSTSTTWPLRP